MAEQKHPLSREIVMGGNAKTKLAFFMEQTWKTEQERENTQQNSLHTLTASVLAIPWQEGTGIGAVSIRDITQENLMKQDDLWVAYQGTATFVNGSKTVIGTGTNWTDSSVIGMSHLYGFYTRDAGDYNWGDIYPDTIVSDTELTLSEPWDRDAQTITIYLPFYRGLLSDLYTSNASIGIKSLAEGEITSASGNCSHAEGYSTSAIGNYTHAEGNLSNAYAPYSHVEGEGVSTYGPNSHAEGYRTSAYGTNSHAEGDQSITRGSNSHSEGFGTNAIGDESHSEGHFAYSVGYASHAQGYSTTAGANWSFASGYGTSAGAIYSSTLAGSANIIHASAINSSVLAGQNITAVSANTAYTNRIEITSASGIIMYSQNGSKFLLVVNNDGSLTALSA